MTDIVSSHAPHFKMATKADKPQKMQDSNDLVNFNNYDLSSTIGAPSTTKPIAKSIETN